MRTKDFSSMPIKKYSIFLILGPLANCLWAFWALPQINERGSLSEMAQWILVQSLFPVVFAVLIALKKKFVFWLLVVYSGFMILFVIGMLGWAMMGPETPAAIYIVCGILIVMAFGLLFNSLQDLKVGKDIERYETQD